MVGLELTSTPLTTNLMVLTLLLVNVVALT